MGLSIRHRYVPRHRAVKPRDEKSNSFAMFIVMLPVIIGAFGLGVDVARNVYIRTTLQNNLDAATVGATAVTEINDHSQVVLDRDEVIPEIEKFYALNRQSGPALECIGNGAIVAGTDAPRCWATPTGANRQPVVNPAAGYVEYWVKERSKNSFLQIVGVKYQDYLLKSQARINQDTE